MSKSVKDYKELCDSGLKVKIKDDKCPNCMGRGLIQIRPGVRGVMLCPICKGRKQV